MWKLFILPGHEPGMGTGHLFRSIRLALSISRMDVGQVYLVCNKAHPVLGLFPEAKPLIIDAPKFDVEHIQDLGDGAASGKLIFFFDYPLLSEEQVLRCRRRGSVIALDPGGPGRKHVPYIVDTLPNLYLDKNVSSPWFLSLPARKRGQASDVGGRQPDGTRLRNNARPFRVLVSLGGEDGKGRTLSLMQNAELRRWLSVAEVEVLLGPSFRNDALVSAISGSWKLLAPIPNLVERLAEYDLLIGIFGLTAFEALALGTPVLLEHPTVYHQKLGDKAGFRTLGSFMQEFLRLEEGLPILLRQIDEFQKTRPAPGREVDLSKIIVDFAGASSHRCPACGSAQADVSQRFEDRSFLLCRDCRIDFQVLARETRIEYGPEYFDKEYLLQYGKTYLEDFEAIRQRGEQRIKLIEAVRASRSEPAEQRLLEIGCAFGPFLQAAADHGYAVQGIDVNQGAIDYVIKELGLAALNLSWRDIDLQAEPFRHGFEVLSLWYVIEHFPDLEQLLRLLAQLLRVGGVLAFSTPSGRGISALRRGREFWAESPKDHFTVWNPRMLKKLLRRYGFRVRRVIPASFHPERFPGILSSKFLRPITKIINRIFQLGDTMEVYAVRTEK